MEKYYRILDLEVGVSIEEVKEAFRLHAFAWHPDHFAHHPKMQAKAQEKMRKVNEAYARLKDYKPPSPEGPAPDARTEERPRPRRPRPEPPQAEPRRTPPRQEPPRPGAASSKPFTRPSEAEASTRVRTESTSTWGATCPKCQRQYRPEDVPCRRCGETGLLYEFQTPGDLSGGRSSSAPSDACLCCPRCGARDASFPCDADGTPIAIPDIRALLPVHGWGRKGIKRGVVAILMAGPSVWLVVHPLGFHPDTAMGFGMSASYLAFWYGVLTQARERWVGVPN